ncbi:MAG: membrane protein insertase YidC [Prevotella sp.]|nr:membrane protein insertase YidC [Prevotella sp.]
MDKNTTTGFILIAIVLIAFSYFNRPSAEEQRAAFVRDSIAQVERMNQEKKLQAEAAAKEAAAKLQAETDTTALFHSAMKGAAQTVVLKNDKVELTLNSKGATVEKAVVKGFKDRNDNPDVTLFQGDEQQLNYTLSAKESNIATQDLFFVPTNVSDTTVTFTATAGEGKTITLDYQLGRDYMLHMQLRVEGMDGLFAPNTQTMDVNWKELCPQQEKGFMFENRYCTLTYKEKDSSTDYLNETSEKRDEQIEEALDWVAFKDQFFSSIMIAKNDFAANSLMTSIPQEKGSGYLKQFEAKMKTFFDPTGKTPSEFEFYYGPNDFRKLQAVETESTFGKDLQMKKLVYLGWPIVRWINRFFTIYVFDFLTGLGLNMGIVLILITLLLKAITYPLVKKSYMSSAKMRVLKPKLDEATKQFNNPEDQMQKQQAMMQEYAKYGVSPLSGCMPMLIQMPIWVAMFNFVPNAIQLRGEKFLWINDLSTYDPIVEWKNSIWGIGDHLSLTCILFCVSNILYSYMTMRQQKDQMVGAQAEQMKMMQWMMYLMPLMFFFMFNDYSSGLNFYYFLSLFFSAAIMFVLRKTTNDAKLLAKLEAKYEENKKNPQKKLGGLAGRLQAMQEEQQRLQKQREELANRRKNLGK